MKNNKLSVPISLTTTLAFILTCALGCAKKNSPGENLLNAPETNPTNAAADSIPAAATTNVATATDSPVMAPAAITNPPTMPTTTKKASLSATEEPAPTKPIAPATIKVVEMPATVPAAPTNFYSGDFAMTNCCTSATSDNYYLRLRGGYQHVNHGDNNDTYWLSVKFFAHGDGLRERAGKNAWLVPDADAEFSHQYLAKPDGSASPGSGEGVQLRASLFWPWLHWSNRMFARTNSVCPMCQPLLLGFGPTANVGFDQLFDGSEARLARYFGVRMTINRDGFIEYTAGGTDGLAGTRQQILAELPFYTSRDGEVRYVFRGLWNTGSHSTPDLFQAGFFVEMPLCFLATPSKWHDLIPCKK